MIIPDLNLLLYAHIDAFPLHESAQVWWEKQLSGTDPIGIAPAVAFGFARIATHRRVFTVPMEPAVALETVEGWLARPATRLLPSDDAHLAAAFDLLREAGTIGNLTTDAQIAAHAIVLRGRVATNDTDFNRFPGLDVFFPLR